MPPNQRRQIPTMDDAAAVSLSGLSGQKEITLQNDMRVSC